jgi:uncharacterized protein with PhoU and TrkA domain
MLEAELHVTVPSLANVLERVSGAAVVCRLHVLREAVVDHRVNQALLASEVVVKRRRLDAGELADRTRGQRPIA